MLRNKAWCLGNQRLEEGLRVDEVEARREGEDGEVVGGWGGGEHVCGSLHFFVPPYEAAFGLNSSKK